MDDFVHMPEYAKYLHKLLPKSKVYIIPNQTRMGIMTNSAAEISLKRFKEIIEI